MRAAAASLLLLAVASLTVAKPKNRFIRYPSWDTKMYPVWKEDDPRFKDSWKGGRVSFNVDNDSPTLTRAKVTFTIDLEFPHNQKVQPDGEVVWAEDCVVNGTKYLRHKPVYPAQNQDWRAVFPDGTPIKTDKRPAYVFVWKTWGQYWQVADGPSSFLTIDTDDIPLGSYTMDIVIYHYRSKEKFIPLGYASTQFSITDQIPFSVSLDQVNDVQAADMRFVQNRAIAFTVTLHDPSQYLSNADITFNWDFGDESGALISRELTVTHTYITSGSYKPQVVIQAVIPDGSCDPPPENPTTAPGPPADQGTTSPALVTAGPMPVYIQPPLLNAVPSDSEDDTAEGEASAASSSQSVHETLSEARTPSPVNGEGGGKPTGEKRRLRLTGKGPSVVIAKRDAGDDDDSCVIYRYGSFCTGIDIFEGIEKVEIVQMENALVAAPRIASNVLDVTVTCEGSLPKEVCSVILDAECLKPIHTSCNMVEPSKECHLLLRHFFNESGLYCINVSMSNDVSFAATSAKVNVDMGSGLSSSGPILMMLGFLMLVLVVGISAYSYKRFQTYVPLKKELPACEDSQLGASHGRSAASMCWNSDRPAENDDCPLLQDRSL
ncbi:premelanosome protein b isoform X2 [Oryzias melastigma]|uniref:Premelanosome protein b n=1 Tax=Oryzias melastigma TaxID=30732 RepID=A0A3B3DK50_ORYME|nr:premelanosome protein b isoform X2 [Oryzias melastigma]